MKRICSLFLFCLVSSVVYGQAKLGLRFSPSLSTNRVSSLSDTLNITKDGAAFKMALGLLAEFSFTDTYSFVTGIGFAPKKVGLQFRSESGTPYKKPTQTYRTQYVQLPALLKLYTDDYAPGARVFFQVGGILDIKIFDAPDHKDYTFIKSFNPIDVSWTLGVGTELELGISTVVFAGFNYNRGIGNVIAKHMPIDSKPSVKNDYFQLEFGLKF